MTEVGAAELAAEEWRNHQQGSNTKFLFPLCRSGIKDAMDLRRVRTFITVAELGTVSKAALHLRIAQPALSRQLADLEQELGLKLFDRVGRRLRLTGEGEQLLGDCRGLLT